MLSISSSAWVRLFGDFRTRGVCGSRFGGPPRSRPERVESRLLDCSLYYAAVHFAVPIGRPVGYRITLLSEQVPTVLIFGGGSGIGRGCAELLATIGWRVTLADLRRPDTMPAGAVAFFDADARDADAVAQVIYAAEREVGELNAGVYAAGTARVTPLLDIEPKEWRLILEVNLTGSYNFIRAMGQRLAGRGGALVAISSIDADQPVEGLAHYCAAKAGMESLARVAALELGRQGVRVNVVAPGVVMTPLMEPLLKAPGVRDDFLEHIPLGRLAEPIDIATTVAFLLSDNARYVTGQTLKVDGGMSLREHARILDR